MFESRKSTEMRMISDSTDLASAELNLSGNISGSESNWKMKLEAAQNVLFCKEVFSQVIRGVRGSV